MSDFTVSKHYQGAEGEQYVRDRLERRPNDRGYLLNYEYFRPYLKPGQRVLDFGAGTGGMLFHIKGDVGVAEGLEVNPAAAKVAREVTGCTVYEGLDQLPADAKYDVITSNHVLEHVRDVCAVLERLRKHLKSGGLFVTKLPVNDPLASQDHKWSKTDVDRHLQTWSPRCFANTLFESGYDVVDVRLITSAWDPRLFFLNKFGLEKPAFWALAYFRRRRQLFAVGRNPG